MSNQKILSMSEVISAEDVVFTTVSVPEWKGSIRIGSLSASDMLEWIDANEADKKTAGLRLLVKSLVDSEGNRIGKAEDQEALGKKNAGAVKRCIDAVLELNGLTDKKLGETVGNGSGETASVVSPTV